MNLDELRELVYEEYVKNGFEERWNLVRPKEVGDIAEVGMIMTEISGVIEAIRVKDGLKVCHDLADAAIRLMNFATRHHIDLERLILLANETNRTRLRLHGKEVI